MSQAAVVEGSQLQDPWLSQLSASIWSKAEFSMIPIDAHDVPRNPYAGPPLHEHGPRIIFCGIPSDYGTAFFLHLIEQRVNLVAVVCSTRWQRTHPKADLIARIAGHLGRPVEITANANSEDFIGCLREYGPDIVVMASFDQVLGASTLAVPTRGWLNVHPSLLPRHRGPEPIYWTIANGDQAAGITVHLTVPRIDAGPILAQRSLDVRESDTAGSLSRRLVAEGLGALDVAVGALASGRAQPVIPRLEEGSYEPPVRDTELRWNLPFARMDRLVRAGHPDQPPYVVYRGQRRYIEAVRRVRDRQGERPGVMASLPTDELLAVVEDAVVAARWRRVGHRHATRPLAKQQFP